MKQGKSIRLFLVDGTPGGIVAAEIMNWTGHVIAAPRSRLADLLRRPELARTGVYFLTGDDPDNVGRTRVYIGESDNAGKRLGQHNRGEDAGGKDFWDRVVVVTSKDANLTKSHARYLESRLIAIAGEAGRAGLVNGTAPEYGYLPEADIADMEFFIEQVRIVLPVLGLDLLRERPRVAAAPANPVASPLFELKSPKHRLAATAREVDGEFVVLAGSGARRAWGGSAHAYRALRQQLLDAGTLVAHDDERLEFSEDQAFSSPSAASAVVLGRADNGRLSWKAAGGGQSYADWQNAHVAAATEKETV
ncbi:GIY-YIG nuclease family protein [Crenobacter cavernae]|uniref:GIY-YIG nuclease family protein n=1 Tax=Crenobacter cavernae TaxID=2290923 RepID=A0ABY0FAA7_9NEIS|nr:GIY-YIG nuclease family protein [Crenobacter cavernae]RXZ42207.1 GIY-YIG nuclease family protein [Crenobacter cavernae]